MLKQFNLHKVYKLFSNFYKKTHIIYIRSEVITTVPTNRTFPPKRSVFLRNSSVTTQKTVLYIELMFLLVGVCIYEGYVDGVLSPKTGYCDVPAVLYICTEIGWPHFSADFTWCELTFRRSLQKEHDNYLINCVKASMEQRPSY
jgi:hypothetical protein